MSTAFWFELVLAVFGFVGFIILVLKFKAGLLQRAKARQLRKLLVPELKAVLPALAAQLYQSEYDINPYSQNGGAITQFHLGLDHLLTQSSVMFPEERETLTEFSSALRSLLPSFQSGTLARAATEDLLLLGQRAVHEMTENGY